MKKTLLKITTSTFLVGALLTGCNDSAEKVEKAMDNAEETTMEMDKANKAYLAEIENYRKEMAGKIDANNNKIAEFKEKVKDEKKEAKAGFDKKINDLEQKNREIKKKMDDYKESGKENWELFKTEFNRDMEELGKAINNFFN